MLWVTRPHLHLDRAATPWLILRFVDPDAVFTFAEEAAAAPAEAVRFGYPDDGDLSSHDGRGTTFRKVLTKHALAEPALELMERMVAAGVRHALHLPLGEADDTAGEDDSGDTDSQVVRAVGVALDVMGVGMGVFSGDHEVIAMWLPLCDALYVWCQARTLPAAERDAMPAGPAAVRSAYLRDRITRVGGDAVL